MKCKEVGAQGAWEVPPLKIEAPPSNSKAPIQEMIPTAPI